MFLNLRTKINGTFLIIGMLLSLGVFFTINKVNAYGECSEYGIMAAYDYLSDSCKCTSGYVFGKDFMGKPYCVSADSVCQDKYGYHAEYDILSESCECRYGYIFGKDFGGRTQCISEDQACKNQLGSNARSTYGGNCECSYGYVISGGQCTDGDTVCHSKHGYNSSYDDLSNSCECDSGYTFDDSNQCVKKQNNVYFTLKELDTDERRAIIKSDYDYRYYLISYNSGCYSFSFRRYLNHQIVVNLGTDFDLDTWDKIVLQDDDEICDITRVERADPSTTLEPEEEEETFYFVPQTTIITPQPIRELPNTDIPKVKEEFQFDETKRKSFQSTLTGMVKTSAALRKCPSTTKCAVLQYIDPNTKVNILSSYDGGEWYEINITDVNLALTGWMHVSVVDKTIIQEIKPQPTENREISDSVPELNLPVVEEVQKYIPWYKKVFSFFSSLFK